MHQRGGYTETHPKREAANGGKSPEAAVALSKKSVLAAVFLKTYRECIFLDIFHIKHNVFVFTVLRVS